MTAPSPSAPAPLFELNLIGDRVARLRRRRTLTRIAEIGAVFMLTVAAVLYLLTFLHLTSLMTTRMGMTKLTGQLKEQQTICTELDALRTDAAQQIAIYRKLAPVAGARIAWAPKLAALAETLPPGMGLQAVDVTSGDVLLGAPEPAPPPEPAKPADKKSGDKKAAKPAKPAPKRTVQRSKDPDPKLVFSVLYLPAIGRLEDPMGDLRDNMVKSRPFMEQMKFVRLEMLSEENWHGLEVRVFKGTLKGSLAP